MWRKLNASALFPVRCPSCSGLSTASLWEIAAIQLLGELLFWIVLVLALSLHAWIALVLFPLGIYLVALMTGALFPLKALEGGAAAAARQRATFMLIGAVALILLIAYVFAK
jgi:hypothetical protein